MAVAIKKTAAKKPATKKTYDEFTENINAAYTKNCGELTALFNSLFEKINTALYSEFEAIYNHYTSAYSDFLTSKYVVQKYQQSNTFKIKGTIPDSCFEKLRLKKVPEYWHSAHLRIKRENKNLIESAAEKTSSSCQAYFDSVFESAKKDFLLETEKCRAFYLKELSKLQESIVKNLAAAKHTEQEITALEKRIACLDELKSEINKSAASS